MTFSGRASSKIIGKDKGLPLRQALIWGYEPATGFDKPTASRLYPHAWIKITIPLCVFPNTFDARATGPR
jgi:hypothetical protein